MRTATPARHQTWSRRAWLVLGLLAVAFQAWALYTPSPPGGVNFTHADKLVHFALFFMPVTFFCLAQLRPVLVAGAFAVHAVVSELVQYRFVAGRSGSPADAITDLAGIIGGWLLARGVAGRRGR
ncbi:VanZ family protein [Luteococcus peritonei]|uniref:VanZ family protein n=1 Tax=Luteococcus peritonei TaxID=88874 RepID=A0ABW4RTH4_9ACTN